MPATPPRGKPKPAPDPATRGKAKPPPRAKAGPRRTAPTGDATTTIRTLYLRLLGIVLLVAFVSLAVQLDGLIGPRGLLPADAWLGAVQERLVRAGRIPVAPTDTLASLQALGTKLSVAPTLGWVLPAGSGVWILVVLGMVASVFVTVGRLAAPALLVAWASYLSLTVLGQAFLAFQWDALLCEVTFASVLVAPWGLRPAREAPAAGFWLLRVILFKLLFFGGLAKLASGDATWRNLTALAHHFETQPLPNPLSAAAHHLPGWVLAGATLATLVAELLLPFAVFGPRRVRLVAFFGLDALLLGLLLTGNYGFFQPLALVLSLGLLTDADLAAVRLPLSPRLPEALPWARRVAGGAFAALLVASVIVVSPRYLTLPTFVKDAADAVAPLRTVNTYGLFARMTTTRPLPVLEARWGAEDWQEIPWRWQTSDPGRAPSQVAPHMPRLDWQLWFAGHGTCDEHPWLRTLLRRVQEKEPAVLRLLGDLRLLGARPPDDVRLVLYRYRFSAPGAPTPWERESAGIHCTLGPTR